MTQVDRRRQRVSLEEQTAILRRWERLLPDDVPIRTEHFPNGRDYLVLEPGAILDLVEWISLQARWAADGRTGTVRSTDATDAVPDGDALAVSGGADTLTGDDLVDALRLLQIVRIAADDTALRLLDAMDAHGVPAERAAKAMACAAEDVEPERTRLQTDSDTRYDPPTWHS